MSKLHACKVNNKETRITLDDVVLVSLCVTLNSYNKSFSAFVSNFSSCLLGYLSIELTFFVAISDFTPYLMKNIVAKEINLFSSTDEWIKHV